MILRSIIAAAGIGLLAGSAFAQTVQNRPSISNARVQVQQDNEDEQSLRLRPEIAAMVGSIVDGRGNAAAVCQTIVPIETVRYGYGLQCRTLANMSMPIIHIGDRVENDALISRMFASYVANLSTAAPLIVLHENPSNQATQYCEYVISRVADALRDTSPCYSFGGFLQLEFGG